MNADDLTSDQAKRLHAQATRHLQWLEKLHLRMDKLGWAADDPLYLKVREAKFALMSILSITNNVYTGRMADGRIKFTGPMVPLPDFKPLELPDHTEAAKRVDEIMKNLKPRSRRRR